MALVIGNAAYKSITALKKPENDATDVAHALKRLGFEVINEELTISTSWKCETCSQISRKIGIYKDKARDAAWALVYYAGHGMEWSGKNWLIPIGAEPGHATDLQDQTVLVETRTGTHVRGE